MKFPFPYDGPTDWDGVLKVIRGGAQDYDVSGDWPTSDLQALEAAGAMRWAIPQDFGGDDLPAAELHLRYEALARSSVSTALILTQRDSAAGLIDGAEGASRRATMLSGLATNKHFLTVGIAQLTTSRQGGAPALLAEPVPGGYRLTGVIPWSTGAALSEFIVAGAALADGRQILFLMESHLSGVTISRPMELVALRSTFTASITLKDVMLGERWMLRGPGDKVLGVRRRSLHLGQAYLATGLCLAGLDLLAEHRSDAAGDAHERLNAQLQPLRAEIQRLSQPGREADAAAEAPRLRGACNDLALRITHTAVAIYKGSALLANHPAQRLAREAMFLLVWSCSNPVIDCTVDLLTTASRRNA